MSKKEQMAMQEASAHQRRALEWEDAARSKDEKIVELTNKVSAKDSRIELLASEARKRRSRSPNQQETTRRTTENE